MKYITCLIIVIALGAFAAAQTRLVIRITSSVTTEEKLLQIFPGASNATVVIAPVGLVEGIAYVDFETNDAAIAAKIQYNLYTVNGVIFVVDLKETGFQEGFIESTTNDLM